MLLLSFRCSIDVRTERWLMVPCANDKVCCMIGGMARADKRGVLDEATRDRTAQALLVTAHFTVGCHALLKITRTRI